MTQPPAREGPSRIGDRPERGLESTSGLVYDKGMHHAPIRTLPALAAAALLLLGPGCAVAHQPLDPAYAGPTPISRELASWFDYEALDGGPAVQLELTETSERWERHLAVFRVPAPAASTEERRWREAADAAGAPAPEPARTSAGAEVSFAPEQSHALVPPGRRPGEMQVIFEYYRARGGENDDEPRPGLLVTPILGGNYTLSRYIARYFAEQGYHTALVLRDEKVLAPHWELTDINGFVQRSIIARRHVLDWMQARPEIDGDRIGSFGVSLGSLISCALSAIEPDRVKRSVLVMCAGDMPTILAHGDEGTINRFRKAWLERNPGATPADLEAETRVALDLDPIVFAPSVDARRVLLFGTRFDAVLPFRNQELLREALGRPARWVVPTGHYTSVVYLMLIRERAQAFLDEALRPAVSAAAAPDRGTDW